MFITGYQRTQLTSQNRLVATELSAKAEQVVEDTSGRFLRLFQIGQAGL